MCCGRKISVGLLLVAAAAVSIGAAVYSIVPAQDKKPQQDVGPLVAMMHNSLATKAGLCVHIGVGDGRLTAALSRDGQFLVHGLATDGDQVAAARETIQAANLAGVVSVEQSDVAKLPYADNIVNLLVVDDLTQLAAKGLRREEIERVLRPGGVAWVGTSDKSKAPFSAAELRRGFAQGNSDHIEVIERHGLWTKTTKPRPKTMDQWTHKRHDADGNPVSLDEQVGVPTSVRWVAGPNWPTGYRKSAVPGVVATDKRLVYIFQDESQTDNGAVKHDSLVARDAYNGLLLWKRKTTKRSTALVSVGERVYTVLEDGGPLVALNADTGEIIRSYEGTNSPKQVLYADGLLVTEAPDGLNCYEAANGKLRWNYPELPRRYIAGDGKVFVHTEARAKSGERVSQFGSLDLQTGEEVWTAPTAKWAKGSPTLVLYHDGVLVAAGRNGNHAVSAADGSHLWAYEYPTIGHGGSYQKVLAMNGLVWIHTASTQGTRQYAWEGLDPNSGAVQKRVIQPKDFPMKHRCSYDVSTEKYFMCGSMDFADYQTGEYDHFSAARNSCAAAGVLPANGLIYSFPHACGCYPMLRGFLGLVTEATPSSPLESESDRFEKGPAFGRPIAKGAMTDKDWPTYRGDTFRSGGTTAPGPEKLKLLWQHQVADSIGDGRAAEWDLKDGGRLSSPVVATGLALVAATDQHRLHAIDAVSGKPRWTFTAGGRIDCPPTVHDRLCLFGSRDGYVYCLRSEDGQLVWRFRAAPAAERIVAYGQLESPWPVVGGVLVHNDLAYCGAGRHEGANGGIFVYALEPQTGKRVWANRPTDYSGVPDVLIGDGDTVQMASWQFDANTGKDTGQTDARLRGGRLGLLNDAWYKRPIAMRKNLQLWTAAGRGSGQMLTFSPSATCGFKACDRVAGGDGAMSGDAMLFAKAEKGGKDWAIKMPHDARLRGMALASERLYVAGLLYEDEAAVNSVRSYSLADGKAISEYRLEDRLVHDCLAIAGNRLYIATQAGRLICLGER